MTGRRDGLIQHDVGARMDFDVSGGGFDTHGIGDVASRIARHRRDRNGIGVTVVHVLARARGKIRDVVGLGAKVNVSLCLHREAAGSDFRRLRHRAIDRDQRQLARDVDFGIDDKIAIGDVFEVRGRYVR